MKKFLMLAAVLAVSGATVADEYIGGFMEHKVTPEYNSGFCFDGSKISIAPYTETDRYGDIIFKKGDPVCYSSTSRGIGYRLQSNLERQLSKEQVEAVQGVLLRIINDCGGEWDSQKLKYSKEWIAYMGCPND